MDKYSRKWFDSIVEQVIERLPQLVREAMEQVPLYVEDYPPRKLLRQMGIRDRRQLWGLFTGVPVNAKHFDSLTVNLPDRVTIYREGLMWSAMRPDGYVDEKLLKKQIRVTILHEYGHYYGMTEEELEQYGYG
jgi:predicted Zn-dependent protease with MMP-like domain